MKKGEKWDGLSPEEKREVRFQRWLSPTDINFKSSEAGKGYKERVSRFIKVIKLEEPDRVPVMLPASVLCTGTPEEVKKRCCRAIEACAPGGGYILTAGASMNKGNPDNLRAMMEAAKEYGVYK